MEPDRTDVRRLVRNLPPVGQDLDLLVTAVRLDNAVRDV